MDAGIPGRSREIAGELAKWELLLHLIRRFQQYIKEKLFGQDSSYSNYAEKGEFRDFVERFG